MGYCIVLVLLAIALAAPGPSPAMKATAQEKPDEKPWKGTGTWNNRRFGTTGPITCAITPKDEKTWEAQFDGTGAGRKFSHKVTMETTKKSDRTLLQGTATIDGDTYRWTGYLNKEGLFGNYRAAGGNNGQFRLQGSRK
jgi:hypothetical protein